MKNLLPKFPPSNFLYIFFVYDNSNWENEAALIPGIWVYAKVTNRENRCRHRHRHTYTDTDTGTDTDRDSHLISSLRGNSSGGL